MPRLIHYLAPKYTAIPEDLAIAAAPACQSELEQANLIRAGFRLPGTGVAYMVDAVRALRLLRGAHTYLEIGTEDKGNLAYVSTLLASDAMIIDIDMECRKKQEEKLRATIPATQTIHFVTGSSCDPASIETVRSILGARQLDAVFIDGNHSRNFVLADFNNYCQFLKKDGFVLIHDVYWEGDSSTFGSVPALDWIDRTYPVYVVSENRAIHRYLPFQSDSVTWGCFGITRLSW